ncbi:MAG: HAMP domain-containing sensor histidine kinase, partial [Bacteroidales bacterium]
LTLDPDEITRWQTYKGWGFIIATAVIFFFIILGDIRRRDKYLQEIKTARDIAENADKIKSAFMSNMSHEVRSPMNAIVGFSELLKEPDLEPERRNEYIDTIQRSGYQLVDLVTNMVDASELQVKQTEVVQSSFCLNDLMDELRIEAESMIANYPGYQTTVESSIPLPRNESFIIADYGKLSRMLYHLIQNAVKFTPSGLIIIGYSITDDTKIRLFVKDTGMGIPEEDQHKLFEPFGKTFRHKDISRGTGLGLNIVKGFITLMEGELHMNSKPGQGTVVNLSLPLVKDNSRNQPG